jgi:hypothetical protein
MSLIISFRYICDLFILAAYLHHIDINVLFLKTYYNV